MGWEKVGPDVVAGSVVSAQEWGTQLMRQIDRWTVSESINQIEIELEKAGG